MSASLFDDEEEKKGNEGQNQLKRNRERDQILYIIRLARKVDDFGGMTHGIHFITAARP